MGHHFNPRSPCGERLVSAILIISFIKFQSTLPVWGATRLCAPVPAVSHISIHAPRVGSDPYLLLG